jgi:hypothetical protein
MPILMGRAPEHIGASPTTIIKTVMIMQILTMPFPIAVPPHFPLLALKDVRGL